mmetsp:Transcript_38225/g.127944  ORF Transcript_38225/g.127944 Transcript_38225/m.127944 type:complete len:298 (-) Transcript_38225:63-956(-)
MRRPGLRRAVAHGVLRSSSDGGARRRILLPFVHRGEPASPGGLRHVRGVSRQAKVRRQGREKGPLHAQTKGAAAPGRPQGRGRRRKAAAVERERCCAPEAAQGGAQGAAKAATLPGRGGGQLDREGARRPPARLRRRRRPRTQTFGTRRVALPAAVRASRTRSRRCRPPRRWLAVGWCTSTPRSSRSRERSPSRPSSTPSLAREAPFTYGRRESAAAPTTSRTRRGTRCLPRRGCARCSASRRGSSTRRARASEAPTWAAGRAAQAARVGTAARRWHRARAFQAPFCVSWRCARRHL